jgi:aldehyde:ferredoxin oxidoreductase
VSGYMGKILRIDLSKREVTYQEFAEETLKKYIGGSCLGAKILLDETGPETDPLGPDNILIFLTGPLVGTRAINFGRYQVVTKSPLTGAYGEANAGGSWGPELKKAGFDGIIFKGKADKPVYLWIENGKVEINDASSLWGKDTYEVDAILKEQLGPNIVTCSIGQAGENQVRIAAIMNDGRHGRTAARCGVGAVMGSKNLKAIVLKGELEVPVFNRDELVKSVKKWPTLIRERLHGLAEYGTSTGMMTVEEIGDLPVKNWSAGRFAGAEKISGQTMAKTILKKKYFCSQCVIGCGRTIKQIKSEYGEIAEGGGPEYETLGMMGANCLIDDLHAIARANELCNRYGLDTIATGAAVSFAMECYENGLIKEDQTGGLALEWGSTKALIDLIPKIAFKEDIGAALSEGTRIAAEIIGHNASEYTVQVRGMEFPAHDPRAKFSTALAYATSARGACHLSAFSYEFEMGASMPELGYPETLDRFTNEGKGELVAKFQDLMSLMDSLTGCKFVVLGLGDQAIETILLWLNLVTGWNMSQSELLECGARAVNLKRLYNVKCGQSRKDDILPPKMISQKRGEGGAADSLPHLGEMLSQYYAYRGWDETGIPTKETLKQLDL